MEVYEAAHFREWDAEKALYRYRNHAETNRAVKVIAEILTNQNQK
jgi:hypothetical protein